MNRIDMIGEEDEVPDRVCVAEWKTGFSSAAITRSTAGFAGVELSACSIRSSSSLSAVKIHPVYPVDPVRNFFVLFHVLRR